MWVNVKYLKNYYDKDPEQDYRYECCYNLSRRTLYFLNHFMYENKTITETISLNKFIFNYSKFDDHLVKYYESTKVYFICG